jgi:hypothetical protein
MDTLCFNRLLTASSFQKTQNLGAVKPRHVKIR